MGIILFFDTSVGTFNRGDEIIMKSVYNEFSDLLKSNFRLNFGTHIINYTKLYSDAGKVNVAKRADLKFICGTDILWPNLIDQIRYRNIQLSMLGLRGAKLYDSAILLGAGCKNGSIDKPDSISTKIYSKHLSKTYIHSVRDDTAKRMMEHCGLKVINTGCPTLWMLTEDFCLDIPKDKSQSVIFALTSENKNPEVDRELIRIALNNYKKIFFWVQRLEDELYLQELCPDYKQFELVYRLEDYENILQGDVEYVGTRLHGGIFALQHKKRAIILSIDHRARGMTKDNNIPCIPRDNLEELDKRINSSFSTEIVLNIDGIKEFKSQFDSFSINNQR